MKPSHPAHATASADDPDQEHDQSSGVSTEIGRIDGSTDRPRNARSGSDVSGAKAKPKGAPQPTSDSLSELREAMNAKIMAQTRPRKSYGSSSRDTPKRVSPIREDESAPPSLDAALTGPDPPVRTSSMQSTESVESNRTIRGSAMPTPSAAALRTPSYPFPYVPGTPSWRTYSGGGHQPFTALSPTLDGPPRDEDDRDTPRKPSMDLFSGGSTTAAHPGFLPPGAEISDPGDPRFPTPSLYDLVLQLNAEPGLETWWTTVSNILHDHFKAERAALIQPMDPSDIENVPWGLKATFSMNGREDFLSRSLVHEQLSRAAQFPGLVVRESSTETASAEGPQKLHPERLRPRLEARHSYAGPGRDAREGLGAIDDATGRGTVRPHGPQRTVTHAPGIAGGVGPGRMPSTRHPSTSTLRHGATSELDFSSVAGGGTETGPYAEVFHTLHSLDSEGRPLIEPSGVHRVLSRGRNVVVTRDYVASSEDPAASPPAPSPAPASLSQTLFGNYRSAFAADNLVGPKKDYEEHEQQPASPWAQSPAPSPAIQSDENENPFFTADDSQVDKSFDPGMSPQDYSAFGQVEAIGIDHASTVIHVPLMHPTLSQPMQSLLLTPKQVGSESTLQRSDTIDLARRAPIAILSMLTSTVPYPGNLTDALKFLAPHLATSFVTAQQVSASHPRTVHIRHRRTESGRFPDVTPMTIEPASLDDIVDADLARPGTSVSGSITSASEYSGRSMASPASSIVGTPGWDPAHQGWTASRSVAGTPAVTASGMVDNYFVAKKKTNQRNTATITPAKPAKRVSGGNDSKSLSAEDDANKVRSERRAKATKAERPATPQTRQLTPPERDDAGPSPSGTAAPSSQSSLREPAAAKQHSLLHSYGADFNASFQVSPSMTPGDVNDSGHSGHVRKGSQSEDMPPPSERLLRTIIDSVPVQIFTAQPETGSLSWVNSKFLTYRGQKPQQVLSDPWAAIHPDDRVAFQPAWDRSLRTNQQLQQKVRLQRFDGSYRWFYVRAAPLKDRRQRVVHWIGTMMDFHDQQLAEISSARQAETAASEAKYRALANSSPQVVFAVSRLKGVTFCNSQWLQYSGQTEAQALGVGFMDHVHPDDLVKCRLPTFDGDSGKPTNVPTSLPMEPKRTVSQSATSSSGSSDTEKALSTSDDASVASVPTIPPQRTLSELASTGILQVSRDEDGRPFYSTEVRLKSKDGVFRWHLVRVLIADAALHDEEETWYGTCTDINDHKTLERDLKETMDEKSRFLSNMSHEIRTPLSSITGMVNFLIDSSLSAEQMEHVNIIRSCTEGLRGLINDILDLSKAEAGMIQLKMDWLYVRALIEEVNDLTSAMTIDKGLELNYLVEEDVPSQIKGDGFRIRQILLNIVGNAIKFTQRGEVFIRCSTPKDAAGELAKNEIYIKFDVVDTGRGFTEKEAGMLFKRFSQIDGSSTKQHGGTGLGLVISRQLAQLHGGNMSAIGALGKGSTFTFLIKATVPSIHDQPPPATPGHHAIVSPVPTSPTVPPSIAMPSLTGIMSESHGRPAPKFLRETTQSPSPQQSGSPDTATASPSVSSGGSDPSLRSTGRPSSLRSERSSVSSIVPDSASLGSNMNLTLPLDRSPSGSETHSKSDVASKGFLSAPERGLAPPMFSILVVASLKYSREATVQHIDQTLPKNIPHQITARESLADCAKIWGENDPVLFTHVVVVLQNIDEIVALTDQVFRTSKSTTAVVLITDLAQRRTIVERARTYDYEQLVKSRRLRFVFKPLKPSRLGVIFDPQMEREMSLDRNQDSAQQVAFNQKQVFEELTRRLGNRDKRVLLVEDNPVNQMVILKFLAKASIQVETAQDGVQCTEKVFGQQRQGYYSMILCDLHMPNKDGYQTCKEIRRWEKRTRQPHLPIIALSANVLGDVYQKCVEAGFNSYMTKPVDFKELSSVLVHFMDCDPKREHEFMKLNKRGTRALDSLPALIGK